MTLAIMQPYFMPYIGYWQMVAAVDKFVIFDDVNYINKGWVNRNNLLINGKSSLFTVSLKSASQNKLINEIEIVDDFSKLKRTIELSYKKAPYYDEISDFLFDDVFSYKNKNLAQFVGNSIIKTASFLGINTEFVYSSELLNDKSLKGSDKILDICKLLSAQTYINAIGGRLLYDKNVFKFNGIDLFFLRPNIVEYPQFVTPFVPSLSIIDVMMFNGSRNDLLQNYKLE